MHAWQQRVCRKSLYLRLNIAMNLNRLLKNSLLEKKRKEHKVLAISLSMRTATSNLSQWNYVEEGPLGVGLAWKKVGYNHIFPETSLWNGYSLAVSKHLTDYVWSLVEIICKYFIWLWHWIEAFFKIEVSFWVGFKC